MTPPSEPPLCKCHGLPKRWHKNSRKPRGGYWECAERVREWARVKYAMDPEWAERQREWMRERRKTNPGYGERNRVRVRVAGTQFSYRMPPEKKDEIKAKLAEYRAKQTDDYRRAANDGWIDTAV